MPSEKGMFSTLLKAVYLRTVHFPLVPIHPDDLNVWLGPMSESGEMIAF